MIDFMLKKDYKWLIWVTHASTTCIHTIHVGTIDFVLVLLVTRARARALPKHHEKNVNVFENIVTGELFSTLSIFEF